ncbi:MAG: PDDEXK nuclease domain-containing protein [Bacteroidota bacterium]
MENKYINFIKEIKQQIIQSRYNAAKLVNKEQLLLYFNTGRMLSEKIKAEKWGESIVQNLADDLQRQLPGLKGFSYRSMKKMQQFYEEYQHILISSPMGSQLTAIVPPVAAELQNADNQSIDSFLGIGFTHHYIILSTVKSYDERWFYIRQAANNAWSKRTLEYHIEARLFDHKGKLPNNFDRSLERQSKLNALEVFQDNYLFDFIQMDESDSERVFEGKLVSQIRDTIMALGKGFCFIGNQHRLELAGEEFFIDLLFFNRVLNSLVIFELKTGKFRPEHAGQMNFYLNLLDDKEKKSHENPSIGVILCKEKNNTVVEYAFRNVDKGMGAATFKTSNKIPENLKDVMPDKSALSKLL